MTRTDEDAAREMEELTGAEAGVNGFVLHMAARSVEMRHIVDDADDDDDEAGVNGFVLHMAAR